jgi:fermentation-respiration switch protein FrsA (DUF1100 family)
VLLLEYPGYGRSSGEPTQQSVTQATIAAYDLLAARSDVDAQRIIAFGRSLGGGPACALTRHRAPAALLLQSTFSSLRPFARRYMVPSALLRDSFDNEAAVADYEGPVLVLHGEHDELIPAAHGRALAAAAKRGTHIAYQCAHNDCPPQWDTFFAQTLAFLAEHGIVPAR